ncbi:protein kinase domain-containing protein [Archangium primigenium]|uniref:protein kinase domain-containing protein n=1 Tax=[Archangium] primigenium TaxID=2792470 RepID=UPI00195EBF73|nr:serine/threonine protein kinase [Archangium primigenium]
MTERLGKYELVRKLATGGMAEVFLAKAAGPMGFEKTLVLKRILPHLAEEPAFVDMFLAEAKLAARLTHSRIAQIFDFGESEGAYFLAMEYIDGPTLRTLIKRAASHGLVAPATVCARLMSDACDGLAFAHGFIDPDTQQPLGLIHRDISPDNILLSRQGEVKVVDFGIAKATGQSARTETGALKGKLPYMAPEQVRSKPLDQRADVYALGVVLYELLTARKPFVAPTDAELMQAILHQQPVPVTQLRPDLPEAMGEILDLALAKDREQRYPDCASFQADLEDFILSVGRPVTTQYVAQYITHTLSGTECPTPTSYSGSGRGRLSLSGTPTRPATASRPGTEPAPVAAPPPAATAEEPTRAEPPPAPAARAPRRWALPLVGGALLLSASAIVGWRASQPEETPVSTPLQARAPTDLTPKASAPKAPEPKAPAPKVAAAKAAPQVAAPPPAVEPAPVEPDAEEDLSEESTESPEATAERTAPARAKRAVAARTGPRGSLELRIVPYATVYVNGRRLGDTPMAPVLLPAGNHTVKLVNTTLAKTVTRSIEVKPEQSTMLKLNLQEE